MKKTFYQFHGDLDFFKIDTLPKEAKFLKEASKHVPQSSDTTGHSHVIQSTVNFKVYQYKDTVIYEFPATATITHEEHRTEDFEAGLYLLDREKEEDPRSGLVMEVID